MSVSEAINRASTWLERNQSKGCWRIPVISECSISTAWSLQIIEKSKKKRRIMDYLLKTKVWETDLTAASFLLVTLLEENAKLARATAKEYLKECRKWSISKIDKALKFFLLKENFPIRGLNLIARARRQYYHFLMKTSPRLSWSSRSSLFYDYLPHFAPLMITQKKRFCINDRIEAELIESLNKDGSYAGNTVQTIKSAYVLRQLGNEYYSRKAISWLDKVFNQNGSFRPILYQDVYDTSWAALALARSREKCVDSALQWLESAKVGTGYPYYSYSYYADPDDTSLVLLLKRLTNCLNSSDSQSLDFLLKSQNPDGGWSFLPFFVLSPNPFARLKNFIPYLDKFSLIHRLTLWQRAFNSTIDMTSRVAITLSSFKKNVKIKKALAKGVKYLLNHYWNGRFHTSLRWTDTDIYETSMALIALFRNGIHNRQTQTSIRWLQSQPINTTEDATHLLWALIEGDIKEQEQRELANFIVSKQSEDGSWAPGVSFFSGSARFYSQVFSTAAPLYVLHLYAEKTNIL